MKVVWDLLYRQILNYLSNNTTDYTGPVDISKLNPEIALNKIRSVNDSLFDFKVVYFITYSLSDAHRIFDTVNTRGVKLSNTDLVKNHIFSTCYSNDDELLNDDYSLEIEWNRISKSLGKDFETLFRYTLIVWAGVVRDDTVLREVKKHLSDTSSIRDFISDLDNATNVFLCITKKLSLFTSSNANRILQGLYDATKHTIHTPIIISVYLKALHEKKDPNPDIEAVVKALDALFVRNIIVGGKNSNSFEETFDKWANKYYNDGSLNNLISSIYEECIPDQEVVDNIMLKNNWTNSSSRYVLTEIYNRRYPTIVIKNSTDIEHILPEDPDDNEWSISKVDLKLNYKKIGNLILLQKSINRSIKNRGFSIKKEKYTSTDYGMLDIESGYIIELTCWNPETIKTRTEQIAQHIIETWPQNNKQ